MRSEKNNTIIVNALISYRFSRVLTLALLSSPDSNRRVKTGAEQHLQIQHNIQDLNRKPHPLILLLERKKAPNKHKFAQIVKTI